MTATTPSTEAIIARPGSLIDALRGAARGWSRRALAGSAAFAALRSRARASRTARSNGVTPPAIGATADRSNTADVCRSPTRSRLAAQMAMASASAASSGVGTAARLEDDRDHPADLLLAGRAAARHGGLDLARRRLADGQPGLGGREQDDAPGVTDPEGRLGVAAEEQPLHGDQGGPVRLDEVRDAGVDLEQPLRAAARPGVVTRQP